MRSVSVRLADLNKVTIPIGFVGENLHTQVRIDCYKLFEDYPNAVPELTVNPPIGDAYPAVVTRDGGYVIWQVEDSDLNHTGNGEIQLSFFVDEVIAKSYIARTHIDKSLVATGDVPTPIENWIDDANEKLAEVEKWDNVTAEATTLEPGESATAEITEEEGHNKFVFGIPEGRQGDPGTPGFSPVIVVTDITGGHRVSITDVGGTQTVDIMDGEKGDTGNGIASAVLNQDYTLTLNFTDGTHYTTPSIRGAKGETGDTGNGIASVTLNQDYTLTITYTNGQSTTTTSIRGEKGETGATPIISIGTVTTLQPGSDATASMDVTDPEHPVLSLGIPEGEPGEVTEDELTAVANAKADIITDTASGSIATFPDGADSLPMAVTAQITPVQDLHGYEYPWVGGAGKNKLPLPVAETKNGVTLVRNADGSVTLTGTASNHTYFDFFEGNFNSTAFAGYKFTATSTHTTWGTQSILFRISASNRVSIQETQGNREETIADNGSDLYFAIRIANGYAIPSGGVKIYPMLRASGESDTFAPYSNVCPISGWDAANITGGGTNLVTKVFEHSNIGGNGVIDGAVADYKLFVCAVKKGVQYTITTDEVTGTLVCAFFYTDPVVGGTSYNASRTVQASKTITAPITGYMVFRSSSTYIYGQCNVGSVALAYETPNVNQESITFPSTVYGGTVKVDKDGSGKLMVDMAIVDMGTLNWDHNGSRFNAYLSGLSLEVKRLKGISSIYPVANTTVANAPDKSVIFSDQADIVYAKDSSYSTAETFKTAVTGQKIVYELETPVEIDLTELEVIETLKGVNNVWADCGNISIEYPADTKTYIDQKVSEKIAASQRLMELIVTANREDSMKATKAYTTGNLLIVNGTLYKAIASIANGATFTVGTNVTETTVAAEIAALA